MAMQLIICREQCHFTCTEVCTFHYGSSCRISCGRGCRDYTSNSSHLVALILHHGYPWLCPPVHVLLQVLIGIAIQWIVHQAVIPGMWAGQWHFAWMDITSGRMDCEDRFLPLVKFRNNLVTFVSYRKEPVGYQQ